MGLQLYRRHSKACKANRPEDSRTGKFEEGRRNWKKCFRQIFVHMQRSAHGAGKLGNLQTVSQPRAVMIALMVDEHLRLIFQPA